MLHRLHLKNAGPAPELAMALPRDRKQEGEISFSVDGEHSEK